MRKDIVQRIREYMAQKTTKTQLKRMGWLVVEYSAAAVPGSLMILCGPLIWLALLAEDKRRRLEKQICKEEDFSKLSKIK